MTFIEQLKSCARLQDSLVCVGLDFDAERADPGFRDDPAAFNKMVIDATADLCCAYKPNAAFYEAMGKKGLDALEQVRRQVPSHIPVILDAKRGDIGNTSRMYAKAAFEWFGADAITVAPYMGRDSVIPFLDYPDKGIFVLCLTSNPGAANFQKKQCQGHPLYMEVARRCTEWSAEFGGRVGLVVGATQEEMAQIRAVSPLPFLVPGVGAQGGDLESAARIGNRGGLAVINSSRNIIFPAGSGDPAPRIRAAALSLRDQIRAVLKAEVP